MPTIDTCRSTFRRLGTVRKRCDRNDAAITSSTSAASTPNRCHVRATRAVPRPEPPSAVSGLGCKRRGPHDRGLRGFGARKRRRDPTAAQDHDSVRQAQNFLHVGRDQHDSHALGNKAFDQ